MRLKANIFPLGSSRSSSSTAYFAGAPRRTFRDGKVQRVEEMAGEIAVGIAVLAAAKSEARRQREAEQLRQEEQRWPREQALRASHVEDRRTIALDAILNELAHVERLRALITALKTGSGDADPRLVESSAGPRSGSRANRPRSSRGASPRLFASNGCSARTTTTIFDRHTTTDRPIRSARPELTFADRPLGVVDQRPEMIGDRLLARLIIFPGLRCMAKQAFEDLRSRVDELLAKLDDPS